ncbi:MAG: PEP-CTERM sorting domain-containing protein [Candidatus Solibacter usitatus]|nr:PEP-CTERM sorting domain-containing protein [Candidatus Solibacter usitatus]
MKRNLLTFCFLTMSGAALLAGQISGDTVSPVPEPGSIILLGTAAAGIGYATWRRSRKK